MPYIINRNAHFVLICHWGCLDGDAHGKIDKLMWYEPSPEKTSGLQDFCVVHIMQPRHALFPPFSLRKAKDKQKSI